MSEQRPTFLFYDSKPFIVDEYKKVLSDGIKKSLFVVEDVRKIPLKYKIDAIVSPANSFGLMDGGIDLILRKMFPLIENKVKNAIAEKRCAVTNGGAPYLPVGNTITIKTDDPKCPLLLCVPTMYLPSCVVGTNNVYNAFYSIMREYGDNDIVIACCGLATYTGMMEPKESAKQILKAYNDYYINAPK